MAAEQRAERAELEPAQVQLAKFRHLGGHFVGVALLDREAADIVRPVGDAR